MQTLEAPGGASAVEDIRNRLAATVERIGELEREQEDSHLSGEAFDVKPLHRARRDREALEQLLSATFRRERQLTAQAREKAMHGARKEVRRQEALRLDAVERAEAAAVALVAALTEHRAACEAINRELARLSAKRILMLHVKTAEDRLTRRLSETFKSLIGFQRSYGQIDFPATMGVHPQGPWRDAEEELVKFEIAQAARE